MWGIVCCCLMIRVVCCWCLVGVGVSIVFWVVGVVCVVFCCVFRCGLCSFVVVGGNLGVCIGG